MKNKFYKKIIPGILIATLLFSTLFFSVPKKSEAIAVFDAANVVQSTMTAINTTGSAFANYSVQFKEFVLDGLATMLAKQIIRQITSSIVTWINTGFEGSPSFVTNPGAFFLDVADQITGEFLAKTGGPLTALCSPFSIDIRIALSFKYHPNIPKRYTCTLSTIIKESKNAAKNSTINGFTAGDFSQGGWPAFVSLTTEPQNNIYGAYIIADTELSLRVANAQWGKKDEISQGRGFLSWRDPKCKAATKEHNARARQNIEAMGQEYSNMVEGGGESGTQQIKSINDCPVQTPGSVIVSSLEANVNGPLHELQLADELNEIVNALFAQLATQILSKGLGTVSGSGPSDSSSYINQIQAEANGGSFRVDQIRDDLLRNLETYLDNTFKYKYNKDTSLNIILDVKNSYETAKTCYSGKIWGSEPPLTSSQVSLAQNKISEIEYAININVAPLASRLLNEAQEADLRYSKLKDIETRSKAAKTVNDLNTPSQEYGQMLQNRTLTTASDVVNSERETEETREKVAPLKQDAERKLQACQLFPNVISGI